MLESKSRGRSIKLILIPRMFTLFGFVDFGNITKERKQAEHKHPVEEEGSQKTRLAAEVDLRR